MVHSDDVLSMDDDKDLSADSYILLLVHGKET